VRVSVTGKSILITDQLQAYVEYRLFASIARYQALIRDVNVTLQHGRGHRGGFLCAVAINLGSGERITIRAHGTYLDAAIDRASDRTSVRLSRRSAPPVSS
jgi:ribosomal subunit interface protein